MEVAAPVLLLVCLLILGVPVAVSLGAAGLVGLLLTTGLPATTGVTGRVAFDHGSSYALTTIPMFILMGELLSHSGLASKIFDAFHKLLSSLRGGLAIAVVVANTAFAVLSGSSTAAAAAVGRVSVPEMRKHGYSERMSMGVVAAAGSFAAMLPPSVPLIVYGIHTETSIGRLFAAGLVPGLLTAVTYALVITAWSRQTSPDGLGIAPPTAAFSWSERGRAIWRIWPASFLVVAVLGGIYSGAITATEAGAVGAAGALVLGVASRGLRIHETWSAVRWTLRTTAMITAIIIGASIFSQYIVRTGAAQELLDSPLVAVMPNWALLWFIIIIYLALGTFMDGIGILLLTLPFTFPLVTGLGYDAVWFGIVIIKALEIGLVTPPVGLNVYVATSAVDGARLQDTFRGAVPFIGGDLVVLLLLISFPKFSTYLPDLLYG